jgi:hypothetical protein
MRTHLSVSMRGAAVAVALLSSAAAAQLPNASTAAFGMGGNFTAIARGYEAIRWNPANLAMPGRPLFSLGVGIGGGNTGTEPIDLTTLHKYSGGDVDSVTRVSWVEQARLAGGQRGRLDAGMTPIALTIGPIGIQAGTSSYSTMNLSPDAWEAFLFGNAGNNGGQPKTLDLTGTSLRIGAISAGAASFALPIPINLTNGLLKNERAAIGITGKYMLGHGLIIADDAGSTFGNNMQLNVPIMRPDTALDNLNLIERLFEPVGKGIGVDVGLSWSGGPWRVGALVENAFNNFAWDTTKFAFTPGTGLIDQDNSETHFDSTTAYTNAPAAMKKIVTDQVFKPGISVGAALALGKSLTLTADLKQYTGGDEAIVFAPKSHFGVGAEWRLLPFLPLRAGVASITDGWQAGAGAGLRLLGYEFGLATSVRRRGQAMESGVMFGIIGMGR